MNLQPFNNTQTRTRTIFDNKRYTFSSHNSINKYDVSLFQSNDCIYLREKVNE